MDTIDDASTVIDLITSEYLRDLMRPNMNIIHLLVEVMLSVLEVSDPKVHKKLACLSVPPFFCVSWLLTWFAHDVRSLMTAQVLFDYFLTSHPVAIIYAAAVVPVLFRKELLQMNGSEAQIHQWLKELPKRISPTSLVMETKRLMSEYPIAKIKISNRRLFER